MASRPKMHWIVEVWDGAVLRERRAFAYGLFTEKAMMRMLQTIVAKYALELDEIIDSLARRGSRNHRDLLQVSRNNSGKYSLSCGENPFATARVESAQ